MKLQNKKRQGPKEDPFSEGLKGYPITEDSKRVFSEDPDTKCNKETPITEEAKEDWDI